MQVIYDKALFLTDGEHEKETGQQINVRAAVAELDRVQVGQALAADGRAHVSTTMAEKYNSAESHLQQSHLQQQVQAVHDTLRATATCTKAEDKRYRVARQLLLDTGRSLCRHMSFLCKKCTCNNCARICSKIHLHEVCLKTRLLCSHNLLYIEKPRLWQNNIGL